MPPALVLRIGLDTSGAEALVRCTLEPGSSHAWPASDFRIPARIDRRHAEQADAAFRVPFQLVQAVSSALSGSGAGLLWLAVQPDGYLPGFPWERQLQPALGVPVLRLQEIARPAPARSATLDVAVCCGARRGSGASETAEEAWVLARRILEAVPGDTAVHVFTDVRTFALLRRRMEGSPVRGVEVHDPATVPDDSDAWLGWMCARLQGVSVDVVHFVGDAVITSGSGTLALEGSPSGSTDAVGLQLRGAPQLAAFLTRIGAWGVAFSSAAEHGSSIALRLLADTLARQRPGPVLHHEWAADADGRSVAAGYAFAFGPPGAPPPRTPAVSVICPPETVAVRPRRSRSSVSPPPAQPKKPAWVAAAVRYAEGRLHALEVSSSTSEQEREVARRTLAQVLEVVARGEAAR